MSSIERSVEGQYGVGGILDSILHALSAEGKDVHALTARDLAPVDEFHIRGREATVELANLAGVVPGSRVLDVGCGLGGSVRYLAEERGCHATGLDLTEEYVQAAISLTKHVGLDDKVDFRLGSALELPFDDGSFDVVWTENAQMNIEDKDTFYSEIHRVLKRAGHLAFHDIFMGDGSDLHYPVPWAEDDTVSSLWSPAAIQKALWRVGFKIQDWEDKSQESQTWFAAAAEKLKQSGPPPLGLHLLMGETSRVKFQNQIRNLKEGRLTVIQAVAEKL